MANGNQVFQQPQGTTTNAFDIFSLGPQFAFPAGGAAGGQAGMTSAASTTPAQEDMAAIRARELEAGRQRVAQMFSQDPEFQELQRRRRAGLEGLQAPELAAARALRLGGLREQEQEAQRRLASLQARSGIRGPLAAAQQARFGQAGLRERGRAEQELLLQDLLARRQALGEFGDLTRRRLAAEQAGALGEAQLGVAERVGERAARLAELQAQIAGREPRRGLLGSIFGGIL